MIGHPLEMFERTIRERGHRPAIYFDGIEISYARLGQLADAALVRLDDAGVGKGDRVGLLLGNTPDYLVLDLALLRRGAVKVPLNPMLTDADICHVLAHSGAKALMTNDLLGPAVRPELSDFPSEGGIVASLGAGLYREEPDGRFAPGRHTPGEPDDPTVIYYTGGTTGRPKGVVHTNRSVAVNLLAQAFEAEIGRDDVVLVSTPLSHAAGLFSAAAIARGAAVHILPTFSIDAVVRAVDEGLATWTFAVPTQLYKLLDVVAADGNRLPGLRTIVYGASPITPSRLRQLVECVDAGLIQLFGQTECPNWGTTLSKTDHIRALDVPSLLDSCGAASSLAEIRVVADGVEVGPGEIGEVCIRAPYVMREYYKNPEATAATLVDGWVHTGDLGMLDDDRYLHLKDRANDMVISGGMNVYSSEVEAALQRCTGVSQVAVIGIPHEIWGEAVAAMVVREPGSRIDEDVLIDHARQALATYKRPKRIEFLDELPLTAFGKPDKKRLRAPFWTAAARGIG